MADWGHLENILPDVASCFHTHYDESITVTMLKGGSDLASITDLQMANDSNVAAVFKANGDIEIIQVFYQWPLFGTLLGFDFSNMSGGMDLLVATAAFRNEPY